MPTSRAVAAAAVGEAGRRRRRAVGEVVLLRDARRHAVRDLDVEAGLVVAAVVVVGVAVLQDVEEVVRRSWICRARARRRRALPLRDARRVDGERGLAGRGGERGHRGLHLAGAPQREADRLAGAVVGDAGHVVHRAQVARVVAGAARVRDDACACSASAGRRGRGRACGASWRSVKNWPTLLRPVIGLQPEAGGHDGVGGVRVEVVRGDAHAVFDAVRSRL